MEEIEKEGIKKKCDSVGYMNHIVVCVDLFRNEELYVTYFYVCGGGGRGDVYVRVCNGVLSYKVELVMSRYSFRMRRMCANE
jgi:hypothetical protein